MAAMFLGANYPLLGASNIIPKLLVITATVVSFHRRDKIAAWCLVPLAAWVAFASVLNISTWQLNGQSAMCCQADTIGVRLIVLANVYRWAEPRGRDLPVRSLRFGDPSGVHSTQ